MFYQGVHFTSGDQVNKHEWTLVTVRTIYMECITFTNCVLCILMTFALCLFFGTELLMELMRRERCLVEILLMVSCMLTNCYSN